jgi:hypothetical protein
MKIYLCSFLNRLALPGLMSLILLSPALSLAATITTFDVSGTAKNLSGGPLGSCAAGAICGFTGMFQVDTTSGTFESSGLDITLPGLPAFDTLTLSEPFSLPDWRISTMNSSQDELMVLFTTAPTPSSLVGFTGGTIDSAIVLALSGNTLYAQFNGSITPAPVPEPSTLVLLAGGIGLVFGLTRRRFAKKSAIH